MCFDTILNGGDGLNRTATTGLLNTDLAQAEVSTVSALSVMLTVVEGSCGIVQTGRDSHQEPNPATVNLARQNLSSTSMPHCSVKHGSLK